MREAGGQERTDGLFTVKDSLFRLAEDIGVSCKSLSGNRWTASKWPKDRRVAGVSFTVHRIFAGITDEEERFATILTPPKGKSRWTPDEANRRAGRQVVKPVTLQEKVSRSTAWRLMRRSQPPSPATCCGGRPWSPRSGRRTRSGLLAN
ncbi:DUF6192 family protein [Streptomyces sp. NPDC049970]|uniref:DUF6192 family protein n=1 Tax=Streptomyces sp. NPDC049970 TaxID=3155033 RepID=UPI00342BFB43